MRVRSGGAVYAPAETGDRPGQRLVEATCGLLLAGAVLLAGSWWWKAGRETTAASAMPWSGEATVSTVSTTGAGPSAQRWVGVQPGDTLWSVAARYGPPGEDVRDLVEELSRLNDLGPSRRLEPGQALRLPAGWGMGR